MFGAISFVLFFFFNDTATTEIYTLSLHDALPISLAAYRADADVPVHVRIGVNTGEVLVGALRAGGDYTAMGDVVNTADRKSTRLNSSHQIISYAVFCLKKKKNNNHT